MSTGFPPLQDFPQGCSHCGEQARAEAVYSLEDLACPKCGGLWWQPLRWLAAQLDFLTLEAVMPDLSAADPQEAISKMVACLVQTGAIAPEYSEPIIQAALEREQLGPTGIGRGVAMPHARHPSVEHVVGALARCRVGIPFGSLDGQPVYLLILLISPPDQPGEHLHALQTASRVIRAIV